MLKNAAMPLRMEVFVREQKVPIELEHDTFDALAYHALVSDWQGRAVATGRLLPSGRIGRLAVSLDRRSTGLGKRVLQALIDTAQAKGIDHLHLHARVEAVGFYKKFGFKAHGEVFDEAGSPHIEMVRR